MKVQTIQKISRNFRKKIQNLYRGPDSIVVEPRFFIEPLNIDSYINSF